MSASIDYSAGDYSVIDFDQSSFIKKACQGFSCFGLKRCPETGLLKAGLHPGLPHLLVRFNGGCLYWYRSRHYDPGVGRFGQADKWNKSVMNPVGYHAYGYVRGNPVRFVDPWGYFYEDIFKLFFPKTYKDKLQFSGGQEPVTYKEFISWARSNEALFASDLFEEVAIESPISKTAYPIGGKPLLNFVIDPSSSNGELRIIDMKHFIHAGKYQMFAEDAGLINELIQLLEGSKSAFDPQDFFSNSLGQDYYIDTHGSIPNGAYDDVNFVDNLEKWFEKRAKGISDSACSGPDPSSPNMLK